MKKLIDKANYIYNHFGEWRQIKKFEEECSEFMDCELPHEWIDECADVFLVALQLYLNRPEIKRRVHFKANRTIKRINGGYYD